MPRGKTKPIYVLHGPDAYLLAEARRRITAEIIGDADPQLCLAGFDADAELADVLDELRTLPLLAPCRVVIVRGADAFVTAHREALEKYFDAPSPTAVLILEVGKWLSTARLAKKLKTVGQLVKCASPEGAQLLGWIRQAATQRGKKIDPAAVNMLAEMIGADQGSLDSELEKLAVYLGDRETISTEDVSAIVTAVAPPEAFAVINAITRGDARAALEATAAALRTRGAEFPLLGQIAWHIRRSLGASQAIAAGQAARSAMQNAKVFRDQGQFQAMLRRRPMKKLQADLRKLIAADLGMKSGLGAKPAMQQLVMELCN